MLKTHASCKDLLKKIIRLLNEYNIHFNDCYFVLKQASKTAISI